ncbi:DsbA family oxidoreductase [Neptunomonas japonica]|uniref:DSBA oxidoreductase n=1 Tax=Neptunomonas japonica JAMM 1380 TaxID=1441457 RepID=A0A7R6PA11_9GAMM|nr:DsbA family oxidoreductase [Neptunomonas japonica]BBB30004.1 DSBA oxidoreductase [Neptunomonas japonica JAMM 1380]
MKTLKIEMIHDVVCSWCPIGYANLQQALRNLDVDAEIHFLPHELNPDMGAKGESIDAHLSRRYQWNQSTLGDYRVNLLAVAKQAGVCIDFSKRSHYYNSNKAHRLIHWCEGYNKQQAMNNLLIDAYFKRGLDISNTQVLLDFAEQLGLDREEGELALMSDDTTQQLQLKKQRVLQQGVTGVPAYIFNGSNLITGSNSVEYFEQVIRGLTTNNQPSVAS